MFGSIVQRLNSLLSKSTTPTEPAASTIDPSRSKDQADAARAYELEMETIRARRNAGT